MNQTLKIVIVLLLAGAIGVAFYLRSSDGAIVSTEKFLEAVRAGETDRAYQVLSEEFQQLASRDELLEFIKDNALDQPGKMELITVNRNAVSRHVAAVLGERQSPDAVLHFVLHKHQRGWQIENMARAGNTLVIAGVPVRPAAPRDETLIELTRETVRQFAGSVADRDMDRFQRHISAFWRQQTALPQLNEAYQAFFDAGLDLTVLEFVSPVIESRQGPDARGVMTVSGYYPTAPSRMHFEQKYIYEGLSWKLVGFSANVE